MSTLKKVDTIAMERAESSAGRGQTKRRHSDEFKARVVAACEARGASVAGIALSHGVNANLVRKWIIKKRRGLAPVVAPKLLPVRIMTESTSRRAVTTESQSPVPGAAIEIELAGAYIRVRSDFDSDALRDVVRILRDSLMR